MDWDEGEQPLPAGYWSMAADAGTSRVDINPTSTDLAMKAVAKQNSKQHADESIVAAFKRGLGGDYLGVMDSSPLLAKLGYELNQAWKGFLDYRENNLKQSMLRLEKMEQNARMRRLTPIDEDMLSDMLGSVGVGGIAKVGKPVVRILKDTIAKKGVTGLNSGSYGSFVKDLKGTGIQANHLNQDAAFKSIIPTNEGAAVGLRGNAFTEIGSQHYNFHKSLESFWNQYRKGGASFGSIPTNAQYGNAVEKALRSAGISQKEASQLSKQAMQNRIDFGLLENQTVPRIPGRLPQKK